MYCFISKNFSFKGQTGFKKQEGTKKEGEAKEGTVESGETGGRGIKPQGMVDPQGSRNLSCSEEGRKVKSRDGEAAHGRGGHGTCGNSIVAPLDVADCPQDSSHSRVFACFFGLSLKPVRRKLKAKGTFLLLCVILASTVPVAGPHR